MGPDNINFRHFKHLGPNALSYFTQIFNATTNRKVISQKMESCKNYRSLTKILIKVPPLLSPITKLLENVTLTSPITSKFLSTNMGTRPNIPQALQFTRSSTTYPEYLTRKITPLRTITVALDMSKAFVTVNLRTLKHSSAALQYQNAIIEYTFNYIEGRKVFTHYIETNLTKRLALEYASTMWLTMISKPQRDKL